MNIETLLHEEIAEEFEKLREMEAGSETYKTTVDGLTKLMDRAIEIEKFDIENKEKHKDREIDQNFKLKQMSDDRKDRVVKNVLTACGIVIPTAVTIWGTVKSINFEKEGTITTIMGRGFINKLLPKK